MGAGREGDRIDLANPALGRWLEGNVAGYKGPAHMVAFQGGHSNPTFRVICGNRQFVLRRKPDGELRPSAHAVDREFQVIRSLSAAGFAVPEAFAYCTDPTILGVEFFVMELVEGRALFDLTLPGFSPGERRALYFSQVDTLAQLHAYEPNAIGLADFGKGGNYYDRQLGLWTRQYHATQVQPIPAMTELIRRLPEKRPDPIGSSVVHGDFRLDNMIIAYDQPRVRAVLDWELSTIGDPLADLSYYLMSWVMPESEPISLTGAGDLGELGIPPLPAMIERYATKLGSIAIPPLDWHFAFNLFRLAAILQGVYARGLAGNAKDDRAVHQGSRVEPLASRALELL